MIEHTLTTDQSRISKDDWNTLEDEKVFVCEASDAYARSKANVETLCNAHPGDCIDEQVQSFYNRTDKTITKVLKLKRKTQ